MVTFKYKAIDDAGNKSSGCVDVSNQADLELRLKNMGLDLISSKEVNQNLLFVGGKKISRQELITFSYYLEQLVRSGVPLLDGLNDLRGSVNNPVLKEVVSSLTEAIDGGKTLSGSLEQFPKIFDTVFISLIRVGEESGMLAEVLKNITESLKWQDELAAQTKKIIMYPAFVGVVVVGVIFFLMIYLVPKLVGFINNMGEEIPLHTKALIYVSEFIANYWYLILFMPIVLFFSIKYLAQVDPRVRYKVDDLKLKVWLVGPILKKIILARFASYFALLYASGVTILNCIQITEAISGNVVMENALRKMREKIADGNNISDSLDSISLFPPLVLRMISVGESTGELGSALENVSYFYDREVKESIDKVQSLIEPILTLVLGAILGWVMLSVLGPIYDIISRM
ncbi:MAG: type II secretion system F family protein [Gammaproteobacteria bacterium]|nr:type II secretion system F family protein [Gammaproteobacteria bacterium]